MNTTPSTKLPADLEIIADKQLRRDIDEQIQKDLRDAVLRHKAVPRLSWVRVSDHWWVCLEDGKPTGSMPHGEIMKAIEENCRRP